MIWCSLCIGFFGWLMLDAGVCFDHMKVYSLIIVVLPLFFGFFSCWVFDVPLFFPAFREFGSALCTPLT